MPQGVETFDGEVRKLDSWASTPHTTQIGAGVKGKLARIIVEAGSGLTITAYDFPFAHGGDEIWSKTGCAAGDVFEIQCPFYNGLGSVVASAGGAGQWTIVYDDN